MLTPLEEELLKHLNNLFLLDDRQGARHTNQCQCGNCIERRSIQETLNRLSPETDIEQWRRLAG